MPRTMGWRMRGWEESSGSTAWTFQPLKRITAFVRMRSQDWGETSAYRLGMLVLVRRRRHFRLY